MNTLDILQRIQQLLEPIIEGSDMFIVRIFIKPTNNVKVFIDSDSGMTVEKSAGVNRSLYSALEESNIFLDGEFSLEVSSPGIDTPLSSIRQYIKNIGRTVLVVTSAGIENVGVLVAVTDDFVSLEQIGKKNKVKIITEIPFSDIKTTTVQVVF